MNVSVLVFNLFESDTRRSAYCCATSTLREALFCWSSKNVVVVVAAAADDDDAAVP